MGAGRATATAEEVQFLRLEQGPHLAEQGHEGREHHGALRGVERADVGQDRQGRGLAHHGLANPGQIELQQPMETILRGRQGQGLVGRALQPGYAAHQAGGGQVVLALEVIGDAGGGQADSRRGEP